MKRVHRITRHNSDFLSDGAGVLIEDAETLVPQEVLHWFGRCIEESPARNTLTYLARNKGEFGLMTVDEYESTYSDLSQEEIRAYVDNLAETLAADPLFEHCRMYAGHGTGIQKCDELCVFIPASTELPLAKECIRKVEEVAYQDMEQDRGPEMGGM